MNPNIAPEWRIRVAGLAPVVDVVRGSGHTFVCMVSRRARSGSTCAPITVTQAPLISVSRTRLAGPIRHSRIEATTDGVEDGIKPRDGDSTLA